MRTTKSDDLTPFRRLSQKQAATGRDASDFIAATSFTYSGKRYAKGESVPVRTRDDLTRLMQEGKVVVAAIR